ncbi:MAG: NAD(P)/FAD-dependent oxidoreductase [Phycisphaerae bacterium]
METDVCIIGAGPAGLFASIFAAKSGAKTVIVEKNTSAGRKLLITGGGRCNLTHHCSVDDFVKAYGKCGRFLRHSLYEFSADGLINYFAERGLRMKIEKDGCVFPVSERAADVAKVLIDHTKELSIRFLYDKKVAGIKKISEGFEIAAGTHKIEAKKVIIATGGLSWPLTGSTGDGFVFAKYLGHKIVEPKASLCTLVTAQTRLHQLKGVSLNNIVIKTSAGNKKVSIAGPLVFTDSGIGGPCVLEISRFITDFLPNEKSPVKITIDLLPEYEFKKLDEKIISICAHQPKKELANVLAEFLPKALVSNICSELNIPSQLQAGQLTKKHRLELIRIIKELPLYISATGPIGEATVTRGGVCLSEINSKTMESKLCPGLYFCGEVINADGPCGGYNLQIAFSTGHLAGRAAAQS